MDAITRKWFDVATVEVVRAPELALWHSDEELIRLSGAPAGSCLAATVTSCGAIELVVKNESLLAEPMVRRIVQEADGYAFHIVNAVIAMNASSIGHGIGSRSVYVELFEASRHAHFRRVRALAVGDARSRVGDRPLSGYSLWPRMGFDADLPEPLKDHAQLPDRHRGDLRLLQLIATAEGAAFWERHGSSLWVEFDLREGSDSWRTLRTFLDERQIEVKA